MTAWADKNLYERIKDVFDNSLVPMRVPWESTWDEIIDRYRPDMVKLTAAKDRNLNKIQLEGKDIYEGTHIWSAWVWASGLQGWMVSASLPKWRAYRMIDDFFKGVDEVNKFLQDFTDHMDAVYRRSDFYPNLPSFFKNACTTGSPVMMPEKDKDTGKLYCPVPHLAQRYLAQNAFGDTNCLINRVEMEAKEAVRMFGYDNLSLALRNNYDQGRHYVKHVFLDATFFYLDAIFDGLKNAEERPIDIWMRYKLEYNADPDKQIILDESRSTTKPFGVWHCPKDPQEVYSRTPAFYAYHDVKSLAAFRKNLMMAQQQDISGRWWVHSSILDRLRLNPRGITVFDNMAEKDLKPEKLDERGTNYSINFEMERLMGQSVERWFHTDVFLPLIKHLLFEHKAPPTATQVLQMVGEKIILLAPQVGWLEKFLGDIDRIFVEMEAEAGNLPEPPPVVYELAENGLEPEFVGPLPQVQKRFHSARQLETAMLQADYFFNLDPMTKYKIIAEDTVERILEEGGLPQDEIRGKEDYKQLVAAVAQRQQMQEGIALAAQAADAVPKLSKAVEANSPLALMAGAEK